MGPDPGIAHDFVHSWWMRWRLDREHGNHDNHVIWGGPAPLIGDPNYTVQSLVAMDHWLSEIEQDTSDTPLAQKIVFHKPAEVHDQCSDGVGSSRWIAATTTARSARSHSPTRSGRSCRARSRKACATTASRRSASSRRRPGSPIRTRTARWCTAERRLPPAIAGVARGWASEAFLPEPARAALLASGIALLALLHRVRRDPVGRRTC
jgi:hypothetical protein